MAPPSSRDPIGLIGAGLMGAAFSARLLAAGFRVLAWDRAPERLAALVPSGVEPAASSRHVAASCERIVLSLPDSKVVAAVLAEIAGELQGRAVILDTSTGEPADAVRFAAELAPRQVAYLDATVSGSSEQLRRGEALCMVGGEAAAFARCRDLLAAFGENVLHVGPSGDGARLKLVTNLVLGLNRAALAEGLALAEAMGLEPRQTLTVLQASAAYSRIMDSKGAKMIEREFAPAARLSQHLKDVRLMLAAAGEAQVELPLTEVHRRLLECAEAAGLGELDNSALIEVLRRPAR